MNVRELIENLEQFDLDSEVRIATQPTYPLANTIMSVGVVDDADDEYDDDPPAADVLAARDATSETSEIVWIATDQCSSYPYAPRAAWMS